VTLARSPSEARFETQAAVAFAPDGYCLSIRQADEGSMRRTGQLAAALILIAGARVVAADDAAEHPRTYFEEAKITVNERAHADGYLRVSVQPENGTPRDASLAIHKRMSENDIAKGVADALEGVLGPDYKVDRTAGEHVKVRKASKSAANFAVEITFNVPGFSIVLDN
jgi:hypothetical protein